MEILRYSKEKHQEIIKQVSKALLNEELVILPTDTVYGIMALADSPTAVSKLYEAKNRPLNKPTALLVGSTEVAQQYLGNDVVKKIGAKFWPGPLTVVKEAKIKIGPWSKIGVRMPQDSFLLHLLRNINKLLMASSANIAGGKAPTGLAEVSEALKQKVSITVDKGQTSLAQASTVIEIKDSKVSLLRQGPIAIDDIINLIG